MREPVSIISISMENAKKDAASSDSSMFVTGPPDLDGEIKSDICTKETNHLLQNSFTKTGQRGAKHFISRSTTSLVRCASLMRPRQLTTNSTNNLDTSASSKLRRLNIFCTIRHRRVPRAIKNISTTFRKQLNVLRPDSADSDELAARDCLLDLDDYLENISKECVSADEDAQQLGPGQGRSIEALTQRQRIEDDEFVPRSMVRRQSFREAMENAMTTANECKFF